MKKLRNKMVIVFILTAVFVSCKGKNDEVESRVASLPYYNDPAFTPHWLSPQSDSLKTFHKIPAFNLTNQDGKSVTDKTFDNKIYITDFFFSTCPGICPKMTANLAVVQEAFKNDDSVLLLSHSVTPDKDSVPVLKAYANEKGVISNKWHLLTGKKEEIYNLARNFYYVEEDQGVKKSINDFLHTENFVLVDKSKHIRGIYNGLNAASVQQLIADVKLLEKEK
ncbi:SCO family protein [Flavobacterium faecale]|uniref:SCO family protein n=1 Tax=Flavobacterium faecale TaxID=1355330 RepID=A0A2S1LIH8_9FLAO|nr:SCO family protein [Flavobacterium faecale]AWG23539.1 SCO family protein [Flavobacterium faecale]